MNTISLIFMLFMPAVAMASDFYVFPTGALRSIGQDTGKIKPALCNGSSPKYSPKIKFKVPYVKTPGMAIDDAAELKRSQMQQVREYLKYYYFYDVSTDPQDFAEQASHSPGYEAFTSAMGRGSVAYAHDLGLVAYSHTLKIPRNVAEDVFKASGDLNAKLFGYEYHSGKFSPRLALENRDFIWKKVLASQTIVREAPSGNDFVNFEVQLDLSMYCSYALSVSDLISK